MQVLFNLPVINNQKNNSSNQNIRPCPSFKMNMSELKGLDQFVARKYKINPQPIKTLEKFYEHCKELASKIASNDFYGRQELTQIQRKAMIEEWYRYITKENRAYTGAMVLMIMNGITAGLNPKEDTLPPVLNKGVLAATIEKIKNIAQQNPKDQSINFNKEYRINLQKSLMSEEAALDKSLNGWIVIPSKEHDPENFSMNVDKLKMLSHDNWCTKSFNAEPYLSEGDFHVYMEQGKPALGVRFVGDAVEEVQGSLNNSEIPLKYYDVAVSYLKNYKLVNTADDEMKILEMKKSETDEVLKNFPNGINNYPPEKILEIFGIKCKKDEDGLLIISHYNANRDDYAFKDLEIDENRLFKHIKKIEGDAEFLFSQVMNLGNLESIGGDAYFEDSQVANLGNLKSIGGDAVFRDSQISSLGNLQFIGGDADFWHSRVTDLGNLQYIGKDVDFYGTSITTLGNLRSIGGDADFVDTKITSLGELESIGRDANFCRAKVTDIGNLKSIGRDADFRESRITDLSNLKFIGGDADFRDSIITSLGDLESIGGNAYFQRSEITNLGKLKSIGRKAWFGNSKVTNIGCLENIGIVAYIRESQLKPSDFDKIGLKDKIVS